MQAILSISLDHKIRKIFIIKKLKHRAGHFTCPIAELDEK